MKLFNLQYLRFLAATLVVCDHALGYVAGFYGPEKPLNLPTDAGVDLFFAISGFIMVHTSMKQFGRAASIRMFLMRRVARIVPLYWAANALVMLLALIGLQAGFPVTAYLASLFFIPYDTYTLRSIFVFPVISLGWTLNYEFLFYIVFSVTLAYSFRVSMVISMSTLVLLVIVGMFIPPSAQPLYFWTRPIILEFIFGMAVAIALHRGVVLPAWARALLTGGGITLLYLSPLGDLFARVDGTNPNNLARVLGWGLPMAMLLAAGVLAPEHRGRRVLRPIELLGDASYSIYLLHPFVLIAAVKAMKLTHATAVLPMPVAFVLIILAIYAVAMVSYLFFERPSGRFVQSVLGERRQVARAASSSLPN